MKSLRLLLATAVVAVGATTCSVPPAQADVPSNVRTGNHGVLDAGWVRALCAATDDGVKCALRYPEGAKRIDLDYRLGGRELGVESTFPYADDHAARPAPKRAAAGRVVDGVRLSCSGEGQRIECVIDIAARYRDFSVTTFVNGWSYGGLRGSGVVL